MEQMEKEVIKSTKEKMENEKEMKSKQQYDQEARDEADEEQALEHAEFLAEWTKFVAVQCFLHGKKHARDEER